MIIPVNYRSFCDRLTFTPRCLLCQRRGHYGLPLCEHCHADLPWLTRACQSCAEPLPVEAPHGSRCGRCLRRPPALSCTRSALRYEFPLNTLTRRYKDQADLPVLKLMARLFAERFADSIHQAPPQLLIPVPLHRKRQFQRGYNQAAELAYWIGNGLGIPMRDDLCQRLLATPHQQGLSAKQRRQNLRRAFQATLPAGISHIAIIDDVITTATTVDSLAHTLQRGSTLEVEAWSIARTPAQRTRI